MIVVYSTGCPKCGVLERKLNEKSISYEMCTDVDKMLALGITSVPVLDVDGKIMDFQEAVKWINEQGE
jgi:hypothetical protein|nr:MAG TPA: NrdH [Caudoviricetes sp.]